MDSKTLDRLISTRGMVKISDRNGWAAGVTGIALGFRPLYGNMKVGFVDDMGEYTGEYTMVPLSMVEEVPEPAEPVCGQMLDNSKVLFENITRDVTCRREAGHRGLHRETIAIHPDTYKWGDDACVPVPEPAEPVFTVKLWYVTGAFEAPTGAENLCRTVFEEALSNDRVIAGELHDARGITLEAFGRSA